MLKRLKVQGYRTLRDIDLPLRPLNVFIGANACGKSNLLDAFALLAEAADERLSDGVMSRGGMRSLLWAGGADNIVFGLEGDLLGEEATTSFSYELTLTAVNHTPSVAREAFILRKGMESFTLIDLTGGKGTLPDSSGVSLGQVMTDQELAITQVRGRRSELDAFRYYLTSWKVYRGFQTGPKAEIRQAQLTRPGTHLVNGGGNLTQVLHNLSARREYRVVFEDIESVLRIAYPEFEELSLPPEGGDGRVVLRWKEKTFGRDFSSFQLSDGILHFLCLVTILSAPEPPPLICIDEPATGLHSDLLPIVVELMRNAVTRLEPAPMQLIVTTHSPQLVDHLEPGEVVVMDKVDGVTQIRHFEKTERLKAWLQKFSLGQLWLADVLEGGRP